MPVPITALYGALTMLFLTALGGNVSRMRGKLEGRVKDNPDFRIANRAHGNAAEWVPAFVVMLLVAELSRGSSVVLHCFGGLFLVARIAHAGGMLGGKRGPAFIGAAMNYLLMFGIAGYALYLRVGT